MPRSEGLGLTGESAKEVWLPDALEREHDRQTAEMNKGLPKGVKPMSYPFNRPWTSIAQAPSDEAIDHSAYDASA